VIHLVDWGQSTVLDNDPIPPVAADDFPEFAEPPQHVPKSRFEPAKPSDEEEKDDGRQVEVDSLIDRLRRERAEGKR
jgi:hypothetical protein